ncbi:cation channel sperm-associated protein subunit gamma-like [Leptonychotes weddellii]|uniref:Cation channel sperm-associated protein subunit gamma-like n=1 Tax=Leptonychotes weddellii TaxID=9713 RepID=A0A7F8QB66_LEPWE|nr:cation channel sperm-associated protein subunit gamma-like [Leptonychotes weddellii]
MRTEKALTDKIAPAWNEKKGQGEEKARSEGKASGGERFRGRERVSKENGRGSTRGRGEGQAQEEPLSKDPGKRRIDKGRVEEQGQLQERGRGKEGKPTQEQAPGEKQGRGQGKGRGVEKVWAQEPEKGDARYRTRYQGVDPLSRFESRCTLPPAMYPAGPAWPKLRILRALWAVLAVLLASWRLWAMQDVQECTWQVVLNKFETVGKNGMSDRFFDQEPLETVDSVFSPLVDVPTDQGEKYLSFPYYLKINYSCNGEVSECSGGELILCGPQLPQIWYLLEGSYRMYKLFPSKAWEVYVSLQVMHQSSFYTPSETMVTLFYEDRKLYQLVYLMNNKQGQLVKRLVPVEQLLMYQQLGNHYLLQRQGNHLTLSFTNFCPFTVMRLRDLPNPQIYTRQERYRAHPPRVLEPSGFHDENSLAVYQGLVYYLLCLHSKYHKPYADPVHDSTWRWWKNKKLDQDYYFYLASNLQSASNVYIDMASYEKIYDLKAKHELPERIFLDKGTSYAFSVFLTVRGHSFEFQPERVLTTVELRSKVDLGVVLADPGCIEAVVKQKVLINRNSVLFWVTLSDKRSCFDQGLSGHHLMKTSMLVKVVGAVGHCFQNTHEGPRMQVLNLGVSGPVLGGRGLG